MPREADVSVAAPVFFLGVDDSGESKAKQKCWQKANGKKHQFSLMHALIQNLPNELKHKLAPPLLNLLEFQFLSMPGYIQTMHRVYHVLSEKCKQYSYYGSIMSKITFLEPPLKTLACFSTFTRIRTSTLASEPFTY